MTNWKALLAAPAAFAAVLAVSGNAVAAEAVAVETEATGITELSSQPVEASTSRVSAAQAISPKAA